MLYHNHVWPPNTSETSQKHLEGTSYFFWQNSKMSVAYPTKTSPKIEKNQFWKFVKNGLKSTFQIFAKKFFFWKFTEKQCLLDVSRRPSEGQWGSAQLSHASEGLSVVSGKSNFLAKTGKTIGHDQEKFWEMGRPCAASLLLRRPDRSI